MDGDSTQRERRQRLIALPVALLLARGCVHTGLGHTVTRVFFSMWVHELGHAVTAWLCGFPAFPGPWMTPTAESRSWPFVLAVAVGLAYLAWRELQLGRRRTAALFGGLVVLQLGLSFGLPGWRAEALILFGGDAGCFVLGSALMATFFAGPDSALHRNGLRWGFLFIGALAFMDAADTWWSAVHDVDRIPFGGNEGMGASDPSRLVDDYGWTVQQLIHRYVDLSRACLVALGGLYLVHALADARAARLERGPLPAPLRAPASQHAKEERL